MWDNFAWFAKNTIFPGFIKQLKFPLSGSFKFMHIVGAIKCMSCLIKKEEGCVLLLPAKVNSEINW
jgi:hypothetical protein